MGRKQEIVNLRAEVAYWRGLYQGAIDHSTNLQNQLLAIVNTNPTEGIVREVMAGFKAVMAPEPLPAAEPTDPYGDTERWLAAQRTTPDPAWDLDQELGPLPDGYNESLEREEAEGA